MTLALYVALKAFIVVREEERLLIALTAEPPKADMRSPLEVGRQAVT
jgi:hypothetical protein